MNGKQLIIANWKMNFDIQQSIAMASSLVDSIKSIVDFNRIQVVLCPSYDSIAAVHDTIQGSKLAVGAQDVFWQEKGSYTGEIAASMLSALGTSMVMIGHSERRKYLNEDDAMVNRKVKAALSEGLIPILCVGETYEQRRIGQADLIVMRQVIEGLKGIPLKSNEKIVIAYEPVWVIGTGQAIDADAANHAIEVIMQALIDLYPKDTVEKQTRIIYGGSADADNIAEFLSLPHLTGALIGTASLDVEKFLGLLKNIPA